MTVNRPRVILHLDLDAFFASVEVLERPELRGKPVIVGGRHRGVVAAASYEARAYGVHSAMPMFQALALCPQAEICHPRHGLYAEYSRRVMDIMREASTLMEPLSIDEAFLDLTYHIYEWEDGVKSARALQSRVNSEVGLSASVGVATNKLLAKVASDQRKPGGLTVVRPGENAAFLAPLPVRVLWGVGPVAARQLHDMGIQTVGDLQRTSENELHRLFGKRGTWISLMAQGVDDRPISTEHICKSVGQERTFSRDITSLDDLDERLARMSEIVAQRLRDSEKAAWTIAIKLRYADFTTLSRQVRLAVPTDDARTILAVARELLSQNWERARPVRLLGVSVHDLCQPSPQLDFLSSLDS